jgi:hypothetical protein
MRRLSNESVNRSSRKISQNSAMDAILLDRFHINTPTLKNVGNTTRPKNMFGKKKIILYFCVFMFMFFFFFVKCCNKFQMCFCVEDEFNVREDNERESGYHEHSNVGEERDVHLSLRC